jgi:hypothetical protein
MPQLLDTAFVPENRRGSWEYGRTLYGSARRCIRCGLIQWEYGTTEGKTLFWLPKHKPRRCK